MRHLTLLASIATAGALVGLAPSLCADSTTAPLKTQRVVGSLSVPVGAYHAPNDPDRLFIVQRGTGTTAQIRIFDLVNGSLIGTPFITVAATSSTTTGDERGLLGLAFHPDFADNGYFYVYVTRTVSGALRSFVDRYTVSAGNPNVADPTSKLQIMEFGQPFTNHNGGWIGFGPDGYLYIATGDGGSGNDPGNRAQTIVNQPLGKMLRVDVDGDDFPADATKNYAIPSSNPFVGVVGDDEIFYYGLRNPWRASFDMATGDFWIADVGQGAWEEVNFVAAGTAGGINFGWRCMEGNACTGLSGCTCNAPTITKPIHVYGHNAAGGISISGGHVYRGCEIPEAYGAYFFGDYNGATKVWSLKYDGVAVSEFAVQSSKFSPSVDGFVLNQVVSFGQSPSGELYVVDIGGTTSGQIFRVIRDPNAEPLPDCNENGTPDSCDIASGTSVDADGNGIPDECEVVPGDLNGDGVVDGADLGLLLSTWGPCRGCAGDLNGDDVVDGADLGLLLSLFTP